jgi:hypothetical protein
MASKGGKRPGAGRKSKAEEMGLAALLDKCWTQADREKCIRELARLASAGEMEPIKLLMAYAYGKPTEHKDITSNGKDILTSLTVNVVKRGSDD